MTVIVQTGLANTASVIAALRRIGADPVLSTDPIRIASAERVVLPGVGSFGPAMERLSGLKAVLRERIERDRPTLGICLGMQLLCAASEESPGVEGLGIVSEAVDRFEADLRVPQLGWNRVRAEPGTGFLESGSAYFANSFRLDRAPAGWRVAWTTYGRPFVAAMERGRTLACQFHPELSGDWGQALLDRWARGLAVVDRSPAPDEGLTVRFIPCLDVRDGRVVKGVQFEGLRDAGDPAERAEAYARQGADELVMLDVSATEEGRNAALKTIEAIRSRIALPLTVGGGVRTVEDAEALLRAGADKVSVNTAAVRGPSLLTRLADRFGRQCTVVAIDARRDGDRWRVAVRAGKELTALDAVEWARQAERAGAGEVLLTSMDRDGTQSGYDLELLNAVSQAVRVPVIASGGARAASHLADAVRAGASAVLAASILHDGDATVTELKTGMANEGVEVRR